MLIVDSLESTQATSRSGSCMMGSSQFRDSVVLFRDFASVIGQERFDSHQFLFGIHRRLAQHPDEPPRIMRARKNGMNPENGRNTRLVRACQGSEKNKRATLTRETRRIPRFVRVSGLVRVEKYIYICGEAPLPLRNPNRLKDP